VTLAAKGRALLIDPGTFEYVGQQRNQFRGTAAHNTLRIDGRDQAEPRGLFGWVKLPCVRTERRISGKTFDLVAASHDAYTRLKSPVKNRRWVFSAHSGFYFVRDVVLGDGEHPLELSWHLAAGLSPQPHGLFAGGDGSGLNLLTAGMAGWSRESSEDWWSPAYGVKSPAHTLRLRGIGRLPTECATLLVPGNAAQEQGTLTCFGSGESARIGAYRYLTAEAEHLFVFAREPGAWQAGAWSSDAEFVYSMVSCDGSASKLICCNATNVSFAGQQIVSCPSRILRCEIICTERQFETFSSDPGVTVDETAARAVAIKLEPATKTRSQLSGQRKP